VGDRLGVLGGTFDPVHIGHLVVALDVRAALGLAEVLLVPANEPWQKVGTRVVTPAADRVAVLTAAVDGVDGLSVSTVDVDRGGPTYTADTLADIGARRPGAELVLIVGTDVARDLATWKRTDEVRSLAALAVVDRAGDHERLDWERLRADGWRYERVEVPRLDVSSTMVRERLASGRPVDFLVPAAAIHCIRERGLYARGR
jgi:nicotinate-nucleotide adenylyltransferase